MINGFATSKDESLYPQLWEGLVAGLCPTVTGPTGATLFDLGPSNNVNGILTFSPTWNADSIYYDGTGTYTAISGLISKLGTTVSAAIWFYNTGNFTGYQTLFDCGGAFDANSRQLSVFLGGSATQLYVAVRGSGGAFINLSATMQLSTWTHLVLTFDGTTIRAYINGIFSGSTTTGVGSSFTEYTMRLAGNPTGGGAAYTGLQDGFAVWSRPLNESEVATLYESGRGGLYAYNHRQIVHGVTLVGSDFTATAGLSVGASTLVVDATFTQPSYTATASLATKANVEASAEFALLAYDATVAIATGPTALTSDATFTNPTYAASATMQTLASLVGSATFVAPTYDADVAVSTGPTTLEADAIHSTAVYSVMASLETKASASAVASFTEPVYSASVSLTAPVTLASIATFSPPVFSSSVLLTSKVGLVATSTFASDVYSCDAMLDIGGVSLAAIAGFTEPEIVAGQYLGQVVCYSQTVVCYRSTVRAY